MKNKVANKCLDIIRMVVATHNLGGISYVEEALRQEVEKNMMRVRLTKETIRLKNNGGSSMEDAAHRAEKLGSVLSPQDKPRKLDS